MMRAKLRVSDVVSHGPTSETITMNAVTGTEKFGPKGEGENNTFARYTPTASLSLSITNPDLVGKFKVGQTFYADFTEAPAE